MYLHQYFWEKKENQPTRYYCTFLATIHYIHTSRSMLLNFLWYKFELYSCLTFGVVALQSATRIDREAWQQASSSFMHKRHTLGGELLA
jgi:hypothetical protein